jgi:hypothetical protein
VGHGSGEGTPKPSQFRPLAVRPDETDLDDIHVAALRPGLDARIRGRLLELSIRLAGTDVFESVSAVVNKILDKLIQIPFPEKIDTGTTLPEAYPQAGSKRESES